MTADLLFQVRSSSSAEVYDVGATLQPVLRITCTCAAGAIGGFCKHRTDLLEGDLTNLVTVDEADISILIQAVDGSEIRRAMNDITALDAEIETLKRKLGAVKKQLSRALNGV
jgi:hypothetical protein